MLHHFFLAPREICRLVTFQILFLSRKRNSLLKLLLSSVLYNTASTSVHDSTRGQAHELFLMPMRQRCYLLSRG